MLYWVKFLGYLVVQGGPITLGPDNKTEEAVLKRNTVTLPLDAD